MGTTDRLLLFVTTFMAVILLLVLASIVLGGLGPVELALMLGLVAVVAGVLLRRTRGQPTSA